MQPVERRDGYWLIRPLLHETKATLRTWLDSRGLTYFLDVSNFDTRHWRNPFRPMAETLTGQWAAGIARSMAYLHEDAVLLGKEPEIVFEKAALTVLKRPVCETVAVRWIDGVLKRRGYLMSAPQRRELLKSPAVVMGGRWAVVRADTAIWIAPYLSTPMPKAFRERCRLLGIPPKVRPYLLAFDSDNRFWEALRSALTGFSS
jgi:tRNA(Ile)-lysidine synthase